MNVFLLQRFPDWVLRTLSCAPVCYSGTSFAKLLIIRSPTLHGEIDRRQSLPSKVRVCCPIGAAVSFRLKYTEPGSAAANGNCVSTNRIFRCDPEIRRLQTSGKMEMVFLPSASAPVFLSIRQHRSPSERPIVSLFGGGQTRYWDCQCGLCGRILALAGVLLAIRTSRWQRFSIWQSAVLHKVGLLLASTTLAILVFS